MDPLHGIQDSSNATPTDPRVGQKRRADSDSLLKIDLDQEDATFNVAASLKDESLHSFVFPPTDSDEATFAGDVDAFDMDLSTREFGESLDVSPEQLLKAMGVSPILKVQVHPTASVSQSQRTCLPVVPFPSTSTTLTTPSPTHPLNFDLSSTQTFTHHHEKLVQQVMANMTMRTQFKRPPSHILLPSLSTVKQDLSFLSLQDAKIGSGSTCVVYHASPRRHFERAAFLPATVAVKVTTRHSGSGEVQILRQLGPHPNIVQLLDYVEQYHSTPLGTPASMSPVSTRKRIRILDASNRYVMSGTSTPMMQTSSPLLHAAIDHFSPGMDMLSLGLSASASASASTSASASASTGPESSIALSVPSSPSLKSSQGPLHPRSPLRTPTPVSVMSHRTSQHQSARRPGFPGEISYIVFERMHGTLIDVIHEQLQMETRLPADFIRHVMRSVVSGVLHAHQHQILINDIKVENIMIRFPKSEHSSQRRQSFTSSSPPQTPASRMLQAPCPAPRHSRSLVSSPANTRVRTLAGLQRQSVNVIAKESDIPPTPAASPVSVPNNSNILQHGSDCMQQSNFNQLLFSHSPAATTCSTSPLPLSRTVSTGSVGDCFDGTVIMSAEAQAQSCALHATLAATPTTQDNNGVITCVSKSELLQCEVKLIDFGNCVALHAPTGCRSINHWYRAPELFPITTGAPATIHTHETEHDVWALGCLLAEMLICKPAFYFMTREPTQEEFRRHLAYVWEQELQSREDIYPHACDLLRKLWDLDPSRRLTCDEILLHPFLHDQQQSV